MVKLEYKSLVTKEIIDYYLSIIKDEDEKEDFRRTVSKFDIRISTEPVIKGEEFYYKIWIGRRGTKKRAHIKEYYPLKLLKEERFKTIPLSLKDILDMIRLNADVPDDFEEYCEISFLNPSDKICRIDYLMDLRRAKRFKKFITKEEIWSIPFLPDDNEEENIKENEMANFIDYDKESHLKSIGFSIIYLKDKREYDKLADVKSTLEYQKKIVERYGYNPYTGEYDTKKFPITKEDKQKENIDKDFDNYFQALEEFGNYLKELLKKYDIKPPGNLVKRLAFNIHTDNDSPNSKQQQHFKFIRIAVDLDYFVPDS